MSNTDAKGNGSMLRPVVGMAVVSLILCGLFFPLLITGIAQVLFPYQANGEIVQFNGRPAGSEMISQNFSRTIFFHPRLARESASGVDPDITVQAAYAQIPRISGATGIPASSLTQIVDSRTDVVSRLFEIPYVNVLDLNIALVNAYPSVYGSH